jgi:hypothetical protein
MPPSDDLTPVPIPLVPLAKAENLPPVILEEFQKRFPGMQIICAGDVPLDSLPPGMEQMLAQIEAKHERSLCEGRCLDCDKQMANYPTKPEEMDTFKPEENWTWFTGNDGEVVAWQCPDCDAKEKAESVVLDSDDDDDPEDTDLWTPAHERPSESQ